MIKVVLDTNVLLPPFLRDVFLEIAYRGVYTPIWSDVIEEEMRRNSGKIFAYSSRAQEVGRAVVERALDAMHRHFQAGFYRVEDDEMWLFRKYVHDVDDAHLVHLAMHANAEKLVTFNLKDFDKLQLESYFLVQGPEDFLMELLAQHCEDVENALYAIALRSGRGGKTLEYSDMVDRLRSIMPRVAYELDSK